jgi:hypothetical protein
MRMPDPNAPLCDCRTIEQAVEDPKCPVEFDEQTGEYFIRCGENGKLLLYHCFFCGGRLPESKRQQLFAHVDTKELRRLVKLTKDIKTFGQVVSEFGEADEDMDVGSMTTYPGIESKPPVTVYYRTIVYYGLSKTCDVSVHVHEGERVSYSFSPKPIARIKKER